MAVIHEVMERTEQTDLFNFANIISIDGYGFGNWISGCILLHLRTKADLVGELVGKELEHSWYESFNKLSSP